jgi:hypothetical protein
MAFPDGTNMRPLLSKVAVALFVSLFLALVLLAEAEKGICKIYIENLACPLFLSSRTTSPLSRLLIGR